MKLLHIILLTLVLAGSIFAQAAKAAPREKPVTEGHRYVFVIEVSKNMERYEEALLETVLNLIETGMHGDMRTGDAFTMWLYRDRVGANLFQPEMWFPDTREQHAQAAGEFIAKLKYDAKADVKLAIDEMNRLIAGSKSVTFFLINDGSLGMSGTPFDLYANTFYREQSSEYRKLKKPFVTAFLAADGRIIDCVISPGGTEVKVPPVPESLRRKAEYAKPAPKVTPTPAPAPQKAKANTPPLIIRANPQPAPPAATPRTTAPALPMSVGSLTPRELPTTPEPVATPPAPAPAPAAATAPADKPTPFMETAAPAAAPSEGLSRPWLLALGGGFLLCAVWIGWILFRMLRPVRTPSLITRSLETPVPPPVR
jgi:hypothetical protein